MQSQSNEPEQTPRIYTRRVFMENRDPWWRAYSLKDWLIIGLWILAAVAAIVLATHLSPETCPPGMTAGSLGGVPWIDACH